MSRSVCLYNQPLWYWYRHVNITLNIDILYQIHFTQVLLFDQTGKILSLKLKTIDTLFMGCVKDF